jgi:hypothetical protein
MIPFDERLSQSINKRYSHLHPLVVQRSVERASSVGELFEILEGVPKKPPFAWDDEKRAWTKESDLSAKKQLKQIMSEE